MPSLTRSRRGIGRVVPSGPPPTVVSLSAIAKPDCDVRDGSRIGGGTPTDAASVFNPRIATAGPTNHLRVLVDGGFAHSGITLPDAGCVTFEGVGSGTGGTFGTGAGFYTLPGANTDAFANAWSRANVLGFWAGTATPARTGGQVTFRNLFMNFNRGTSFVDVGNAGAGVSTPAGTPGGDLTGKNGLRYYLGFLLAGYERVTFEGCTLIDAPAYLIGLAACGVVRVVDCDLIQTARAVHQDGAHLFSGCSDVFVSRCKIASGDDGVAVNLDEPAGTVGQAGRVVVAHNTCDNAGTLARVYGNTLADPRKVIIQGNTGTVRDAGVLVGLDQAGAKTQDIVRDLAVVGNTLTVTSTNPQLAALVLACSSVGALKVQGNTLCESPALPAGVSTALLRTGLGGGNVRLSSVSLLGNVTYRGTTGAGLQTWVDHGAGLIDSVLIDGNVDDCEQGVGLTPLGSLVRANGGLFGRVVIGDNSYRNRAVPLVGFGGSAGTAQNALPTLGGSGLLRSGLVIADANAGPLSYYRSTDQGNAVCLKDDAGLVAVSAAPASTAQAAGSGAALLVYAKNQYLSAADNAHYRITGSWERDGWVTLASHVYTLQPLFGKYGSTATEWLVWWGNGTNQFNALVVTTAGAEVVTFPTPTQPGLTYHVRFTLDRGAGPNGTISLDVNNSGTPVTLALVGTPVAATAQEFRLGSSSTDATWHLDGSLDKVSGTPRVRTALERAWLYNGGHGRTVAEFGTGDGAALTYDYWYDFETAPLTADSSGNALTLTAVGAPVRSQGVF